MVFGFEMRFLIFIFLSFVFNLSANAQVFAPSKPATEKQNVSSAASQNWKNFYGSSQSSAQKNQTSQNLNGKTEKKDGKLIPPAKEKVSKPEEYIYNQTPQVDRPTLDGVKRGRTSVVPVVLGNKKQLSSEGYIYLFYSDFKLDRMMSGTTTCDVSFLILSTLDRRLNSLAVRLKWPHMDTPVNFIDINPNQRYNLTYTLLGDGCYSMDKIPNIVVNRCRVKGMTQEECARKIRWIRKI